MCIRDRLGTAGAAGTDRDAAAKTKLTIESWPEGLFGILSSGQAGKCARDRRVVIFNQSGRRQNPAQDDRVGTVRSKRLHGFSRWSLKDPGPGRFYAKARATSGCKPAVSRTIGRGGFGSGFGSGSGGALPSCSPWVSESPASVCRFDQLHIDITDQCKSFGASSDSCTGNGRSGPFPWANSIDSVVFKWSGGARRTVEYDASRDGETVGMLHGTVPDPGSSEFSIDAAFAKGDGVRDDFYTPDLPGQKPGELGGPLHLNFNNGRYGADIYIEGYLYLR